VYGSELTQANVADAISNVIPPDFRVSLSGRCTLLLDIWDVRTLEKLLQCHAAITELMSSIDSQHELGQQWLHL
jgi:hypothetical protein